MWLPGHLAVSFLACIPLVLYYCRRKENLTLITPYIAFFAVLPDFLHFEDLRTFSHSIVGLTILVLIALMVLHFLFKIRRAQVLIASVAAGAHLAADWLFGHFFPLYPFSNGYASLNSFNTNIDIQAEVALFSVAFVVFAIIVLSARTIRRSMELSYSEKWNVVILILPFLGMDLLETVYFLQNMTTVGLGMSRMILLVIFLTTILGSAVLLRSVMSRRR
jgi:hypothetical protein